MKLKISEEAKSKFSRFRKWTVVFKILLQRGYMWCNVPLLALVGAGTLSQYIPKDWVPGLRFWHILIITFLVILFTGWLDKKYRFLDIEQEYLTEINPLMMKVLEEKRKEAKAENDKRNEAIH